MRLSGEDGAGPEGDLELASCADEVEEFSARMRQRLGIGERSIAHTSSDNAADALAETIAGFFNPRSGFTRLRRQDRPRRVIASPPQRARKMFKYMPGTTWYQEAQANHDAGIYVYPSYEHCLKRDAESFPTDSVLLNAPRAIAAVLCWNEASWAVPVCYGVNARQQKQVRNATFAPGPVTLIRRQVTTLTLEDEVAQMEAQLTKIREGNILS
eukprot:jgi/Tetstr1/422276/TSEL_013120.t2